MRAGGVTPSQPPSKKNSRWEKIHSLHEVAGPTRERLGVSLAEEGKGGVEKEVYLWRSVEMLSLSNPKSSKLALRT